MRPGRYTGLRIGCVRLYVRPNVKPTPAWKKKFKLALPTFDTILFNSKQRYIRCRHNVHKSLVACANACIH